MENQKDITIDELARMTQEGFTETQKVTLEAFNNVMDGINGIRDEVRQYRTGVQVEVAELRERLIKLEAWQKEIITNK